MSLKNNWKPTDTLRNTDVNDIANEVNKNTEHKETKITNTDGVHGIKYDVALQKLQYKDTSQQWQDINTGIEDHKNLSIASENGVHNFKYDPTTKSLYYYHDGEWLPAEIEGTGKVSVSGLTADTIKSGVTVVVKRGEEEVTRIVGTFTNDSNAVASDILSGKTAYVGGQKITGNIITRNGDQSINAPSVSGSYLYTPKIPNGNYNNTRFYFNKGNLSPENIKQGVNIFGVNGNHIGTARLLSQVTIYMGNDSANYKRLVIETNLYFDSSILSENKEYVDFGSGNKRIYFNESTNVYINELSWQRVNTGQTGSHVNIYGTSQGSVIPNWGYDTFTVSPSSYFEIFVPGRSATPCEYQIIILTILSA